jgi:hypothetical protein
MILNSPIISGSLTVTGNIITSGSITISGSIASASYASNADLLDGLDATVFTLTSSFNAQTASFTAFTASLNAFSASVLTFTGSALTRLGALESYTSSLNAKTASFATTGSNTFIGSQVVSGSIVQSGSFTTTGTIIAQTINVQTVTSSIVYSSGSNIFGNLLNNTQTFTGSVLVTGSLTIAGASSATSYNGATIFGSTIACSPIGCFATSCATSFIGGTMSGTTIYGSTAVCSANGLLIGNGGVTATCNYLPKFTGASTIGNSILFQGTNNTLSNVFSSATGTQSFAGMFTGQGASGNTGIMYFGAGEPNAVDSSFPNIRAGLKVYQSWNGSGTDVKFELFTLQSGVGNFTVLTGNANGSATFGGALSGTSATFSSTITGTTIYGSTTVCSPSIIACTTSAAAITIDGYSKLSFKDRGTEYGTINASRYNFGGESTMMSFQSGNCFLFLNGTNCLMFIGSNGNVGIGTSSPSQQLSFGMLTNSATRTYTTDNQGTLSFYNLTTGNLEAYLDIASVRTGNDSTLGGSNIRFLTQTVCSTTSACERMRITSGGNICIYCQLSTGPYVTIGNQGGTDTTVIGGGSGAGSSLRMNYAGGSYNNLLAGNGDNYFNCLLGKLNAAGGVKFGNGATTLNYYEQGTWTPRLKNGSFTTNAGVSNVGWYTRIGNLVTVGGTLDWGAGSGAQDGNSLQIACLPFASSNVSNERNVGQPGAPAANSIGFKCTTKGQLVLVADPGASYIYLIETFQNGTYTTYIHDLCVANAGTLYGFQMTYHTL